MTLRNFSLLVSSVLLVIGQTSCSKVSDVEAKAESQIREIEREWAETAVTGDASVIQRILADDFLGTSPEGVLYTKQQFLDDMRAHPSAFSANQVNDVKVRFFNDVAVAQGNESFARKSGELGRFVWTDVLVRRDGKWQVIAAEDLIAPAAAQPSSGGLFLNSPQQEQDRAGINKTRNDYVLAWRAANADQIVDLYTDDAWVLYPNQPALTGRSEILAHFKSFFAEFKQEEWELTSAEMEIVGPWAFDRGTYRWKGVARAGGDPMDDYGKYLVVLKRQPDGGWKVARDMDNSDRPVSQTTRGAR